MTKYWVHFHRNNGKIEQSEKFDSFEAAQAHASIYHATGEVAVIYEIAETTEEKSELPLVKPHA